MGAERLTFGLPTPLGGQMDCMLLTTPRQVRDMVQSLKQSPVFLDTETDGLNPRKNRLVAIQILQEEGLAYVLDWRRLAGLPGVPETLSDFLGEVLSVGHNIKFDLNFLYYAGIELGRIWDTKTAQQVLDGQGAQEGASFALKDVAATYHPKLDMSKAEREWFYKDLPKSVADWLAPFPEEEVEYMALDVAVLSGIYQGQQAEFDKHPSLVPVMELEMRVLPALAAMERTGIRIDREAWRKVIADKGVEARKLEGALLEFVAEPILRVRLEQYDKERVKLVEWEAERDEQERLARENWESMEAQGAVSPWGEYKKFYMDAWRKDHTRPTSPKQDTSLPNVGSSQQLLDAFGVLDIPAKSTDAKKLAPLEADYPAVKALVRFRKAQKFVDAFGESLLSLVETEDGVEAIHPDYNAIGAATGRMSCRHPNWQQVPARGDGRRLRECVVARPDCSLVVCDFSNIELRILAAYSKDPNLIAMLTGSDMHSEMAYRMFNLAREVDVKEETFAATGWTYRDVAKKINYGLVYGMSSVRLSSELRIGKDEAQKLMDAYFDQLPKVRDWLARAGKVGVEQNFARTKLGRVRRLDPRQGVGRMRRQAMNTPIQGTSADITKLAVANYHEDGRRQGQLVAVVHDELVAETYTFRAGDEMTWLEDAMDKAQRELLGSSLPFEALPRPEAKVSSHWEH